jgi:DNA-binding PadR family transcriptional regulator
VLASGQQPGSAGLFYRPSGNKEKVSIALDVSLTLDISRYMSQRLMTNRNEATLNYQHRGGRGRHALQPEHLDEPVGDRRSRRRGDSISGRQGRPFYYGELRLLALAMIKEEPRHGYELIRAIEERMGGSYSPSPGVIYPTLSCLEDMGYASVDAEQSGRKRYRITAEGESFLAANRGALDALFERIGHPGGGRFESVPASILRGMENLKLALRLRLRDRPLADSTVVAITDALDEAARTVERS